VFVQASKKWLAITKTPAYSATKINTAAESFKIQALVHKTWNRGENENWINYYACVVVSTKNFMVRRLLVEKHFAVGHLSQHTVTRRHIMLIRKEFLSKIIQVYYWRLFCATLEHYSYLQLVP
jgi:hypothetical protein